MSAFEGAHAHNALTTTVQMYGAILTDKQAEIDTLRAALGMTEQRCKDLQRQLDVYGANRAAETPRKVDFPSNDKPG